MAEYLLVALCGAGLGATELLSRYRDSPFQTLTIRPARNYLLVNAALAIVSLFLVQTIASELVPDSAGWDRAIYEVLIAGFGGAILFRSAIVRSRIGDADIGVGPSFVIETLLAATDRQVDRQRAIDRADTVALMSGLTVPVVTTVLVPYTLGLLQNLSAQERQDIETRVDSLVTKKVDEDVKPFIFGLMLINLIGKDCLGKAKTALQAIIDKKIAEAPKVPAPEELKKVIEQQRTGLKRDDAPQTPKDETEQARAVTGDKAASALEAEPSRTDGGEAIHAPQSGKLVTSRRKQESGSGSIT